MKIYVGQTRSRWFIAQLAALGYGECTNRGELPPRRYPWFYDNGAYVDWKAGRKWDEDEYRADLALLRANPTCVPDFLVAPDIVAGGAESLARSRVWLPELRTIGPVYLALQDGMELVPETLDGFNGAFVGGDDRWKADYSQDCVELARRIGVSCHLGRAGTPKKVAWAKRIRVDSLDSSFPLWSKGSRGNLGKFITAVDSSQTFLFPEQLESDDELQEMLALYRYHNKRMHALSKRIHQDNKGRVVYTLTNGVHVIDRKDQDG